MSVELKKQGSVLHYPVRSNCSAPLPPAPSSKCSKFVVTGAGTAACNGNYLRDSSTAMSWTLDNTHAIYKYGSDWHIAQEGEEVFYSTPA